MKGKKIPAKASLQQESKSLSLSNNPKSTPSLPITQESKADSYSNLKILQKLPNNNMDNKDQLKTSKNKPLLRPLSNKRKTIEKISIECDTDKVEDAEYLHSLSPTELSFYRTKAPALYHFLLDINLVRYIDDFIQDGFETESDLLLIKEDYFEESKAFDHSQQKKILDKVKEVGLRKSTRPRLETCEFGTNTSETNKDKAVEVRCWNCLNNVRNEALISKEYYNGLIMQKTSFCSEKCLKQFDKNIIVQCNECKKVFDKAKGDNVVDNNHYCSKKCVDDYLVRNHIVNEVDEEEEYQYDPMEDF